MAPFGASCVLLFFACRKPAVQPMMSFGGMSSRLCRLPASALSCRYEWWAVAIAVGLANSFMALLSRLTPSTGRGQDPIIVFVLESGSLAFLLLPVSRRGRRVVATRPPFM